jgi:hypothetical protein
MTTDQQTWVSTAAGDCGARADDRGAIGGGPGYSETVSSGDYLVRTDDELLAALAAAKAGETIFLPGDVELDLTERVAVDDLVLHLPAGVVLASDRGMDGSAGALLCSDYLATRPLIKTASGVRVTGLRLRGPDPKRRLAFHYRVFTAEPNAYENRAAAYYRLPNSQGIYTEADGLEVDNCEISAWSHAGILPRSGVGHRIHHNFIHHCQRMGLGYGVTSGEGAESCIAYNLFQDNKHHIAATGAPGNSYEACHNIVRRRTESHFHPARGERYGQDHIFDVHGGRDRGDGTDIAGDRILIHHNTLFTDYLPVAIRGVPANEAIVEHNWFVEHQPGDQVVRTDGGTTVRQNAYGTDGELA